MVHAYEAAFCFSFPFFWQLLRIFYQALLMALSVGTDDAKKIRISLDQANDHSTPNPPEASVQPTRKRESKDKWVAFYLQGFLAAGPACACCFLAEQMENNLNHQNLELCELITRTGLIEGDRSLKIPKPVKQDPSPHE